MHHPQSPVPTRSPTPPILPPSASGPLPPGRHTFSSGDFYSAPPTSEPREPWSPRRGYRNHPVYEAYNSPQPQYTPHPTEHRPERSSSWTPRSNSPHHYDHRHDPNQPDNNESSGGLSVPSLGGEGRPEKARFSPKLHLAPRANRSMMEESGSPPRPPNYGPQDFRPPTPLSPRFKRSNNDSSYYHCAPVEEEKKTSDSDKIMLSQQLTGDSMGRRDKRALSSRPQRIKNESRSSPDQDDLIRECNAVGFKIEEPSESRASPGDFLVNEQTESTQGVDEGDDQSEETQAVDDIAMSPIPYDREDPVTLMDLPDDILALPISPCGPHDDPALS